MAKKRIGIIGASGYTGNELLRLLAGHGATLMEARLSYAARELIARPIPADDG